MYTVNPPLPVQFTVPALVNGLCKYFSPLPPRFNTPLLATVSGAAMVPELKLIDPLTLTVPGPASEAPARTIVPLPPTELAKFRFNVTLLMARVCLPLSPPKVRLLMLPFPASIVTE